MGVKVGVGVEIRVEVGVGVGVGVKVGVEDRVRVMSGRWKREWDRGGGNSIVCSRYPLIIAWGLAGGGMEVGVMVKVLGGG